MSDKLTRVAIVNSDKCKPKKCRQECKKSCPVVRSGKLCIEVSFTSPPPPPTPCIPDSAIHRASNTSNPRLPPNLDWRSSQSRCVSVVEFAPSAAHSVPSQSSTCLPTSKAKSHIATRPTASSSTGFLCRDPEMSLV
ncbi:hypothetical protein B0H67DRAFT_35021 [Lasiosphaeris hirsuta]|uniref:RNase L inhibitor RLI-like possible metal-binding domain-containing protein n=1 Tax=Lasiosphaeris hirsuta TaxID=260670 RepID=A0AA40BA43_9PEZI|nr:hypothetical protein B0H67DRAFT_35021 [Lasiosphaeris hirsuta]